MTAGIIKSFILTLTIALFFTIICDAQIADTALVRKLSINGICLCNATLSSLKQLNINFRQVEVEEMDLSRNCYGQDSRFEAGKGYYSDKYPGLIFQKDQSTDQISKIRLTKKFNGKLPDGKFVSMDKFLLKDLFKMYPKLKDKWGSRGCSDYWNFSNDTLSFYLKIDKSKQPQFPVDEAYYADKPIEAIDLVASCYSFRKDVFDSPLVELNSNDPVFFLDSIRVNRGVLANFLPSEFASITIYKDSGAIKRIGAEGKNGVIYLETKQAAKRHYWNYFKSKSTEYAKIIPDPENDSSIQYILNKRILKESYEPDLASVNDKTFKGISIINKRQLIKDYGVMDKNYGVIILADVATKTNNLIFQSN